MTSQALILPGESREELEALDAGLREALGPVGAAESILVDRVVFNEVRRRRIERAESSLLMTASRQRAVERARRQPRRLATDLEAVRVALGPDAATEEERQLPSYTQAIAEEEQLARIRDDEDSDFGVTFATSLDLLDRLERHRTAAERSIDRAIHELLRLQERRLGGDGPVPAAVDVTIDVDRALSVEGA